MTTRIPDIENLTSEQTIELAAQCFSLLSWEQQIEVLQRAFDKDMRAEVVAQLEASLDEQ